MAIVSCPDCSKKLKVADTSVGKKVKCSCGNVFVAHASPPPAAKGVGGKATAAPDKVLVACTECGAKLKVATASMGKKMKCPKCASVFIASADEEVVAPPPKKAPARPAVSDDDMDDLMSFAEKDAENESGNDNPFLDDDDDVKPKAKPGKKADFDDEDEDAAPKWKSKKHADPDEDMDDDEPMPKPKVGKKEAKPSSADDDDAADQKPVYPRRTLLNLFVLLLLIGFITFFALVFLGILPDLGLPRNKGPVVQGKQIIVMQESEEEKKKKEQEAAVANKKEAARLEGTWVVASAESDGKALDDVNGTKLIFADGKVEGLNLKGAFPFTVDASNDPKWIDVTDEKKVLISGIFKVDGDTLHLSVDRPKMVALGGEQGWVPGPRPTQFDSKQGTLYMLQREGKQKDNDKDKDKEKDKDKDKDKDKEKDKDKKDTVKLDGEWIIESALSNGKTDDKSKGEVLTFADGKVTGMGPNPAPYTLNTKKDPHWIDVTISIGPDKTVLLAGIFKFDGEKLFLCVPGPKSPRPKGFDGKDGSVAILGRAPKDDSKDSRKKSVNNLKQIGLAIHNYHDQNGQLPPAGSSAKNDATGKPLLSWRVAILPYIEEVALYQEFDLDKPWDDPKNMKLIAKMPKLFMVPGVDAKEGMTHYRTLVGPGTVLEPKKDKSGKLVGRKLFAIPDGTSNVIMVVEAKEAIIWTKPDDLPYDPKGPLPKFGVVPAGFNAAFADGSVRFIPAGVPEKVLRPYLTCDNATPREPLDGKDDKGKKKEADRAKDKEKESEKEKGKPPEFNLETQAKQLTRQKEERAWLAVYRKTAPKDMPGVVAVLEHEARVVGVAFSPASPILASVAQYNRDEGIRLWDLKTLKAIKTIPVEIKTNEPVVAFAPTGDFLAVLSNTDKRITVWSIPDGKELKSFDFPKRPNSLAFSSDGKRLSAIIGDTDEEVVKIWELPEWKERPFNGKLNKFDSFLSAPSGDELFQINFLGPITIHDLTTGKTRNLKKSEPIASVAGISPDGKYLAYAGFVPGAAFTLELLDLQNLKREKLADDSGRSVQFSPDGKHLLYGGGKLFDIAAKKVVAKILGPIDAFAFSPGGVLLARGEQGTVRIASVEDLASGKKSSDDKDEKDAKDKDAGKDKAAIEKLKTLGFNVTEIDGKAQMAASNKCTNETLALLAGLPTLEVIDLTSSRGFDAAGLAHLKKLPNLKSLRLTDTNVTDAGMAHLAELKTLENLNVAGTRVTDKGMVHIKELVNLNTFVPYREISNDGLAHLKGLTKMRYLNLLGCEKVTDAGLAHLKDLIQMEELFLNDVPISDAGLAHLASMSKMTRLWLTRAGLTDKGLVSLSKMTQMNELKLNETKIDGSGLTHLRDMKQLVQLNLSDSLVTDAALANLKGLDGMRVLDVSRTRVSAAGEKVLKGVLPECTLYK